VKLDRVLRCRAALRTPSAQLPGWAWQEMELRCLIPWQRGLRHRRRDPLRPLLAPLGQGVSSDIWRNPHPSSTRMAAFSPNARKVKKEGRPRSFPLPRGPPSLS
jgi:hypothetical protein